MWGAPGTMLAARAMADWTGEQRWLDAWNESADALRAARDADGLLDAAALRRHGAPLARPGTTGSSATSSHSAQA